MGLKGTVTRGVVSAIRNLSGVRLIQVDASINPGTSGGPLLNSDSQVIGVKTAYLSHDTTEGIGFAVSVEEVCRLLSGFAAHHEDH